MTSKVTSRRALIVLPSMLAAFCWIWGVIATIISSQIIIEKFRSTRWPQTSGTVERLAVNRSDHGSPYINFIQAGFVVDGKSYTVQDDMDRTGYSESLYRQGLSVGDPVPVYYDPENPRAHPLVDRELSLQMGVVSAASGLLLFIPALALSFLLSLTQPLTLKARIRYSLRLFASFLLSASTLIVGMDRTVWLVFYVPAVAVLLLLAWRPALKRKSQDVQQTS